MAGPVNDQGGWYYLTRRGVPTTPDELLDHACLTYRWRETGAVHRWHFTGAEGGTELAVTGPLQASDTDVLVAAALAGLGLVYLPRERLATYLADERLAEVLPGRCPSASGFFLYYAHRRLERPALRALIDHFRL